MEFIRIQSWPVYHAKEAYKQNYFIEAIQVLHGWIECQARGLLLLVGSIHFNTNFSDTWDYIEEMSFKDVVKALLVVGQINKQETRDLLRINAARNKMIHKFFKDPYQNVHHGFPKQEYDRVFNEAILLADKISEKCEFIVG